ncbi:MAG: Rrf2 family transcriptional regulator, partial [Lewinella sp.]
LLLLVRHVVAPTGQNAANLLSKKSKYAINALVYLARYEEDQPISVSRIAEDRHIPLKFLEAILTELKNARILKSKKGKYGGYSLNGSPEEIDLAQVVRLFDGAIALLPCVTHDYYEPCEECIDEETCGIRQVALEIRNATVARLKGATLASILERERKMRE